MDDRRALMAAITADPDEDTPRLVLADWLDEHGDAHDRARAELIRLQCGSVATAEAAGKRVAALVKAHGKQWLGPLWEFQQEPVFERGLLRSFYITPGKFIKPETQRALAEQLPLLGVDLFMLAGATKKPDRVAGSPALSLVPRLMWWDTQMDDAGLKAFAASPHTGRLTTLNLEKLTCSDTGLKALARSPCFARLRRLRILDPVWGGRKVTAAGVRALVAGAHYPRLDTFAVTGTWHVNPAPFCKEPRLDRLKHLHVRGSDYFAALAGCPHLTALERLEVESYDTGFTDADAAGLLANPALARLTHLSYDVPGFVPQLSGAMRTRLSERFGTGFTTGPSLSYH